MYSMAALLRGVVNGYIYGHDMVSLYDKYHAQVLWDLPTILEVKGNCPCCKVPWEKIIPLSHEKELLHIRYVYDNIPGLDYYSLPGLWLYYQTHNIKVIKELLQDA